MVEFLEFVGAGLEERTGEYENEYVRKLQAPVANIKSSREMEVRFMLWEELIDDERKDAKVEDRIEVIMEILSDLCEEVPAGLAECIQQETNLDILKDYCCKARKASSTEEFEKMISEI